MTAEIIQLSPRQDPAGSGEQANAMTDTKLTITDELRRARIRILQLESSLTAALRDSVRHHDRALGAERRLEAMKRRRPARSDRKIHPA